MATSLDGAFRGKRSLLSGRPLVFQRGRPLRTGRKRPALKTKHVLAAFILLAGFFFALDKAYVFLVSWDALTVRTIELRCGRDSLRGDLSRFVAARPLGNILLCDIEALQRQIKALSWVRDVRVQKVFPSTLKIEVTERVPFAVLEKGGLFLVDEDGVVLESPPAPDAQVLPLVRDEGAFADLFPEKWQEARDCLKSLTRAERARLASLECSDDGRMTLSFKDDPVSLIVDGADVRAKLDLFAAERASLEARFGPLEYADLRFDGRIIVRPKEPEAAGPAPKSPKEAE
jgi:cell division septal protein FtsQ